MTRRALGAVLAVAVCIALVPVSGMLGAWVGGGGQALRLAGALANSTEDPNQQVQRMLQGEGALDDAEQGASLAQAAPLLAEQGLGALGQEDVRVGAQGRVVGFSLPGAPAGAFECISQELQKTGWRAVPSGQECCGTFVKEEGRLKWMLISCANAGEEASVVVQCAVDVRKEEQ